MGIILKNLLFTYNPKKLIICGELSQYGNYLLDDILNIVYEKNSSKVFISGKAFIILFFKTLNDIQSPTFFLFS